MASWGQKNWEFIGRPIERRTKSIAGFVSNQNWLIQISSQAIRRRHLDILAKPKRPANKRCLIFIWLRSEEAPSLRRSSLRSEKRLSYWSFDCKNAHAMIVVHWLVQKLNTGSVNDGRTIRHTQFLLWNFACEAFSKWKAFENARPLWDWHSRTVRQLFWGFIQVICIWPIIRIYWIPQDALFLFYSSPYYGPYIWARRRFFKDL